MVLITIIYFDKFGDSICGVITNKVVAQVDGSTMFDGTQIKHWITESQIMILFNFA